ncbi:MAG TPA: hypothetical protein VF456_23040, partial [Vicinamibacterales bacterium]
ANTSTCARASRTANAWRNGYTRQRRRPADAPTGRLSVFYGITWPSTPANQGSGVAAFDVAVGGSLCVRSRRLPHDLPELLRLLDRPDSRVQLIVCTTSRARIGLFTIPMPIEVPPLGIREIELPRIIQAYADEVIAALSAPVSCLSEDDQAWVIKHDARSLSDIEKATLRIVALRMTDNVHQAARMLGMAPVSLSRWLGRRMPLARLG